MVNVTLVVDALAPQLSGIGRYTWELCQRLPREPAVSRLDFFVNGRFVSDPRSLLLGQRASRRARMPRWLNRRLVQRRLRSGVVHGANYFLPADAETGIITVHDLSVLRFPETHPPERVRIFERDFERSLGRASHIITDTDTIRDELNAMLGVPKERITAVPLGVGREFRPRDDDELELELREWGLRPGRYGLCVSTLEPRKKIGELLRAWRRLPEPASERMPLVLVGGQGWLNVALHDQIDEAAANGWLKHLGYVPEASLPALYSGARLFVYPSIYEGFGLPPLESMASGVPVLVADRSCLPEVCGDAAGYVDPDDTTAFAEAIAAGLVDEDWRISARQKGLERASIYDWKLCAAQTAAVYRRVYQADAAPAVDELFGDSRAGQTYSNND